MEYVMGIDLGTSSVKAILIDREGNLKAVAQKSYDVEIPRPGFACQRSEIWWERTKAAIGESVKKAGVSPAQIKAAGFSGQMHGLVALDREKRPLMPAVIWMDQRSRDQQKEIIRVMREHRLEGQLMNRPVPGMMLCSLLWVKENQPEIYEKIAYVLLPKDYIRFRLGGTIETDETDGAGSLAFSVRDRKWCRELLENLQISEEIFPKAVKPYDVTGRVTKKAAQETGLMEGTILAAGGADSAMQLTGNGVVEEHMLAVNIGTASQILTVMSKPVYDGKLRTQTLCHAASDLWYQQCGSLNGGNALSWLKNRILASDADFAKLDQEAAQVPAGSSGVLFLPYLAGERVPYENPDARGVFYGLSMEHGQAHLVRSVMEGIVLNLRQCLDIFEETGIRTEGRYLIASGGGARGKTWRQIQADIFNMPVYKAKTREEACTGAAMTAAVGAGWFHSVEEAAKAIAGMEPEPVCPIPENVKRYQESRERFRNVYSSLFDNTIGVCYDCL